MKPGNTCESKCRPVNSARIAQKRILSMGLKSMLPGQNNKVRDVKNHIPVMYAQSATPRPGNH